MQHLVMLIFSAPLIKGANVCLALDDGLEVQTARVVNEQHTSNLMQSSQESDNTSTINTEC